MVQPSLTCTIIPIAHKEVEITTIQIVEVMSTQLFEFVIFKRLHSSDIMWLEEIDAGVPRLVLDLGVAKLDPQTKSRF